MGARSVEFDRTLFRLMTYEADHGPEGHAALHRVDVV